MNFIPLRTPAPLLRGLYVANFGSFLMRFWTFSSSSPSTGIKQEAEQKKKSGKFSYLFYFYAGVNISQKNQNYSVRKLRKFQKYSELLKKNSGRQNTKSLFWQTFCPFLGQFLVSKGKVYLILVKFHIKVDFLTEFVTTSQNFSEKSLNSKNSSVSKLTEDWEIFTPEVNYQNFWHEFFHFLRRYYRKAIPKKATPQKGYPQKGYIVGGTQKSDYIISVENNREIPSWKYSIKAPAKWRNSVYVLIE